MTDGLEYLGRARMQGLALLVLAFLVGALAGAAGDRVLSRSRSPRPQPQESQEKQRLPKVLEDMDLTPVQRAAIDSILASGRPRNEAIMNQVMPRFRAVSDSLRQAIRAVLTPAQATEFDAFLRSPQGRAPTPPAPRQDLGGARDERPREATPPGEGSRERRPPPRREGGPPEGGPGDRRPPPPPGDAPPPPRDGNR